MNSRNWLANTAILSMAANLPVHIIGANGKDKPIHILLVSGWQTVNIGDSAHTSGMIHLFHRIYLTYPGSLAKVRQRNQRVKNIYVKGMDEFSKIVLVK